MKNEEKEILKEILKYTKIRLMMQFGQLTAELKAVETHLESLKRMEKKLEEI